MAIGRLNIGLTGVQPGGLAKVIPSSVAVGSGSGSVDSNGTVTFSGASSVSLNSCFNSTYDNYLILLNITTFSAGGDYAFRFRNSSSDYSGSVHNRMAVSTTTSATTPSGYRGAGENLAYLGGSQASSVGSSTQLNIFKPYLSLEKNTNFMTSTRDSSGTYTTYHGSHQIGSSSSYDGITFFNSSGNITGTIRVYGYAN